MRSPSNTMRGSIVRALAPSSNRASSLPLATAWMRSTPSCSVASRVPAASSAVAGNDRRVSGSTIARASPSTGMICTRELPPSTATPPAAARSTAVPTRTRALVVMSMRVTSMPLLAYSHFPSAATCDHVVSGSITTRCFHVAGS